VTTTPTAAFLHPIHYHRLTDFDLSPFIKLRLATTKGNSNSSPTKVTPRDPTSSSRTKSQDTTMGKEDAGNGNNVENKRKQDDSIGTPNSNRSTGGVVVRIPSVQHTQALAKQIKTVREKIEQNRKQRAILDRRIVELGTLQTKSSILIDAQLQKYIYAQAYLRILGKDGTVEFDGMQVAFCRVGNSSSIFTSLTNTSRSRTQWFTKVFIL
jgi:hypothetical protein